MATSDMTKTIPLVALIATLAVALAGCSGEPTPEERQKAADILPSDCRVYEVGAYGNIKNLVVVRCDGNPTTSANLAWSQQSGKITTTVQATAVTLESQP